MQILRLLLLLPAALVAAKPNVIFILTDDLGYYAPGYNNPELITPTLDDLASNGVTLTHHYTYMFCAPSRGAFLTGRLPYKLSATRCNYIPPTIQDGIDLNFTMLPKKLQEAGYISHHVGKWHQGLFSHKYTPQARGFATTDGFLEGGEDHFTQNTFYGSICDARDIWVNGTVAPQYQGIYTGFRITGTAVNLIQNHAARYGPASDTPLFMYLALHNTHAPLEAPQKYLDMYPNVTYLPKRTFYAMTAVVDEAVANVTRALKDSGLWNNTLLVWTTDNGSPVTLGGSNYPLRGSKTSNWEGGTRTPAFVNGGVLPNEQRGKTLDGLVHIADWYATFASLAGLNPADPNTISPVDGMDFWPYISGANSTAPRDMIVYDHNMYGNATTGAIRVHDWKLLVGPQLYATWYGLFSPNESMPNPPSDVVACSLTKPCLFNLTADPTEHEDVSGEHPNVVNQLMNVFKNLETQYHPPKDNPISNATGYCGAINASGGYVAPWL